MSEKEVSKTESIEERKLKVDKVLLETEINRIESSFKEDLILVEEALKKVEESKRITIGVPYKIEVKDGERRPTWIVAYALFIEKRDQYVKYLKNLSKIIKEAEKKGLNDTVNKALALSETISETLSKIINLLEKYHNEILREEYMRLYEVFGDELEEAKKYLEEPEKERA